MISTEIQAHHAVSIQSNQISSNDLLLLARIAEPTHIGEIMGLIGNHVEIMPIIKSIIEYADNNLADYSSALEYIPDYEHADTSGLMLSIHTELSFTDAWKHNEILLEQNAEHHSPEKSASLFSFQILGKKAS